jgi:hypothetical protein
MVANEDDQLFVYMIISDISLQLDLLIGISISKKKKIKDE